MSVWKDHADAIISALSVFAGVVVGGVLDALRRRHDDREARRRWRRDQQRAAYVDLLRGARLLHQEWEATYERRRQEGDVRVRGSYDPDERVEAAFTTLMAARDVMDLLPAARSQQLRRDLENVEESAHALVVACRAGTFFDDGIRRASRKTFLEATRGLRVQMTEELAASGG